MEALPEVDKHKAAQSQLATPAQPSTVWGRVWNSAAYVCTGEVLADLVRSRLAAQISGIVKSEYSDVLRRHERGMPEIHVPLPVVTKMVAKLALHGVVFMLVKRGTEATWDAIERIDLSELIQPHSFSESIKPCGEQTPQFTPISDDKLKEILDKLIPAEGETAEQTGKRIKELFDNHPNLYNVLHPVGPLEDPEEVRKVVEELGKQVTESASGIKNLDKRIGTAARAFHKLEDQKNNNTFNLIAEGPNEGLWTSPKWEAWFNLKRQVDSLRETLNIELEKLQGIVELYTQLLCSTVPPTAETRKLMTECEAALRAAWERTDYAKKALGWDIDRLKHVLALSDLAK